MIQKVAVRAVIVDAKSVLCIRESPSYVKGSHHGLFDMPGGKIRPGESPTDALEREVLEEIGITIYIHKPFFVSEWYPKVDGEALQILGIFYLCSMKTQSIQLGSDHDEYTWIPIDSHHEYPLMKEVHDACTALGEILTAE